MSCSPVFHVPLFPSAPHIHRLKDVICCIYVNIEECCTSAAVYYMKNSLSLNYYSMLKAYI